MLCVKQFMSVLTWLLYSWIIPSQKCMSPLITTHHVASIENPVELHVMKSLMEAISVPCCLMGSVCIDWGS